MLVVSCMVFGIRRSLLSVCFPPVFVIYMFSAFFSDCLFGVVVGCVVCCWLLSYVCCWPCVVCCSLGAVGWWLFRVCGSLLVVFGWWFFVVCCLLLNVWCVCCYVLFVVCCLLFA